MNIEKLIAQIIPPTYYQDSSPNFALIDKLTTKEKKQLEVALIEKLTSEPEKEADTAIVDTLVYLKSHQALPILIKLLEKKI